MQPTIILASQSKQRKLLMDTLGIPFEVLPADIDEKAIQHADPIIRAELIAQAKAQEIARTWSEKSDTPAVIIAADTFCFMDGEFFEKPVDAADAIRMITALSGKTSTAVTGFCMIQTETGVEKLTSVQTSMSVRELSSFEISRYVETNEVTQWSGGFSPAYHEGMALFDSISGSLTSFSHGFPMEIVVPSLRKAGIEI